MSISVYNDGETIEVAIESIVRDENQPRKHFDEDAISVLANSIENDGLIQNIAVRPTGDGKFIIVAGERRFRAFQKLNQKDSNKWNKLNCVVRLVDDEQALNLALLENIQREDLLPLERAEAVQEYKDRNKFKTQKELAKHLGMSEQNLSNLLKLNKLTDSIKDEIRNNKSYTFHDLIPVASKNKENNQLEMFEKLKRKIEDPDGKTEQEDKKSAQNKASLSDEEKAKVYLKLLLPRCPGDVEKISKASDETFEEQKFNIARIVKHSLECLEKLSEIENAISLDLNKKHSVKELKDALDKLIQQDPKNDNEAEQASEPTVEMFEEAEEKGE